MALIPCPECKREISTSAPACPHCGYQSRPHSTRTTSGMTGQFLDPMANARGCLRIIFVLIILWFVLVVISRSG